jgi:hypothetical protein
MGNWNEDGKERDLNEPEEITGLCWDFECPKHNICMYSRGNWKPENGCKPAPVPFGKRMRSKNEAIR